MSDRQINRLQYNFDKLLKMPLMGRGGGGSGVLLWEVTEVAGENPSVRSVNHKSNPNLFDSGETPDL